MTWSAGLRTGSRSFFTEPVPRPALRANCERYWMPSNSTSKTSVLFGGIFGLGLDGP